METIENYRRYEQENDRQTGRRLIWFTREEDPIPHVLLPQVKASLEAEGKLPDRETLAEMYYGYPIKHADIFLGNNKPNTFDLHPPLLTMGDLYFTVNPSLAVDHRQWRHILYDHLFSRSKYFRDYAKVKSKAMDDIKEYSRKYQGVTLGEGMFHEGTQTWRPVWPK